jgi:RNA polymerase sigma factor (sigma-70 family)
MGSSAALRRFPRGPRSALVLRVVSDERLVEYVRGGSEAAFEAVYDRHHRGILAFARHMLRSPEEAEDVVQHTFMAAYRHLVAGTAEIQLRPWLYTIARNRCLSILRTRRERPLEQYEEPATEHLSAEAQRRSDVRDLLADVSRLPEDQRAALVLAELGAVSHDEIATVLGVRRDKVKALVFQARSSLAASRKARETPCAEIREQIANLSGGALRRTTLHRHLRECPGCRAFRDEVALQRKTLAVALPVAPTLGLKEAALGAAFGSGGAGGGGVALSGGSALAAKALVAVALVGGGTTATVEVTRHAIPAPKARAAERSGAAVGSALSVAFAPRAAPTGGAAAPRPTAPAVPAGHAERKHRHKAAKPAHHADKRARHVPPGQAKKSEPKQVPPGQAKHQAKAPPGQVKHSAAKAIPPGQAKRAPKSPPPGQAKKTEPKAVPPGRAKKAQPAEPELLVPKLVPRGHAK